MYQYSVELLKKKATAIRIDVIKMLTAAGSGHSAGSLGMADIFTALYFGILNHEAHNPNWDGRDRLILSNGHIVPVRYAAMAEAGYFPLSELETLRRFGSRLQGHPERTRLTGLETTSGPLGSGIGQAAGMAMALRMDGKPNRVFVITSDGEHDEGNTWEAILIAAKYRLSNLTVIVDRNEIQIGGSTEDVLPLGSLADKYRSFGWNAIEIDGHDFPQIFSSVEAAQAETTLPTVIIVHTIPGKGVSFMERNYLWHGKVPSESESAQAIAELSQL